MTNTTTTRPHWHITKATPGYMPWDDEPWIEHTKTDAVAALKDEKRNMLLRDMEGELYFTGNARQDLTYWVEDRSKMHDLGVVIEATQCSETECEEWMEAQNR